MATPVQPDLYEDTFNRKVAELNAARTRINNQYASTYVNTSSTQTSDVDPYAPPVLQDQNKLDLQSQQRQAMIDQAEAEKTDGSGVLTTANLNSTNPFVYLPTNTINAAALAIGGLAKISTNTAALLADDLPRIYQSIGTPTPVADAYNRYVASNEQRTALGQQSAQVDRLLAKGTINPVEAAARKVELQTKAKDLVTSDEDMALLSQRNSLTTSDSYLEQLDKAQLNIQEAKVRRGQVEGDTTSDVMNAFRNVGNRNAYRSISEANKGNEEITALDATADQQYADGDWIRATGNKALATGKAALNVIGAGFKNPLGSLNLAAEMAPQLITRPVTLASSLGAAGEQNVNSLEQYQKREGKAVAGQGEGLGMLGISALYGGMDYLSDRLMAKGFQGQTNATRALADVVPKTTAKAALGIITKPVTKTLQAATPEAITEGAQTAIEDSYGSLGTSYDSASVGTGAGLGALVSGVLQGKNSIKAGVQEAALDIALSRPKGLDAIERAKQRRATDAIPTEELTDITHPNYNPTASVQRFGAELTPDTTPEQAMDIKNRINEVTSNIENKIGGLQQLIDDYPVELGKIERNKIVFDNARAAALADGDTDLINALNEKQAAREQIFNDQFPNFDIDKATATLKSLQQDLLQTDKFASSFNTIIDSRFPDAVNAPKQAQNAPVSDSAEPVVQTPINEPYATPGGVLDGLQAYQPGVVEDHLNNGGSVVFPAGDTNAQSYIGNPGVNATQSGDTIYVRGIRNQDGSWSGTPSSVPSIDTNTTPTTVTDQSVPNLPTTEPVDQTSTSEPVIQQSRKDFDDIVSSYPSESTSIAASKLADDTSNDLTDTQRTTLRKLSDAIVVANRTKTLNDVSKDVTEGSKGYRGLNQYISSMMNAVRAGKKAVQGALVSDINSFNDDHAEKAQLVRQAIGMVPKGMAQEVLRTKTGWELGKQVPMSQAMSKKYQAEMNKSGSLAIHSGSETIVKGIEDESSAISVVADTLKAIQESQQAPKQPSKAQEDTLEQELEQLTGKKVVVPTEASKPVTTTDTTNAVEQTSTEVVNTKEQAAVTKAEPRVEAKPVIGKVEPVNKEPTPQEALDKFNEQDRAERQAKNETRQIKEIGKANETKVSQDESVPVEETPVITVEDSADIQPEVVNTEATEPVVEAKPVKGITAIQATKEERTKLQEEVLEDNGETVTGFQRTNLVKAYFTQKGSSILATTKDLVSSLTDGGLELMTKVLGNKPTTEQVTQMKSLIDFIQSQQKSYKDLMKNSTGTSDTSDDFKYRDYLQYLYEGKNPELEENIMTAASLASYTWLLENGGKFYATQEQVAGMLGQPNLKSIPYPIYQQFNTAGKDRGAVIRSLGSRAYEALGMSITKDADPVHKDKLVNALGAMAYQTLLDQGYLQITPMTGTTVQGARRTVAGDKTKVSTEQAKQEAVTTHFYVRAAHNVTVKDKKEESSGVISKIKSLQDDAKGTDGLMTKLFGVTNREVMPVTKKPTELTQKVVDDVGTEVASHLAENVLKAMQTPHQVSNLATVYGLLEESDRDLFLGMMGYVSDVDLEKMHISNRESQQAINEGILRSIENMKASLQMLQLNDLGDYSDFYLPLKVWAVNRAGVVSNMLNEQGDKIHRSMTHIKSHKQEVTIGDSIVDGQITQYGYFLLGIAGGMEGTKSIVGNTSDKTTAAEFLPNFEAYIASQPVQNAIESMVAIKSGNYTSIDVKIVAAMNKEFGMNAMSMASLNALAEMSQSKDGKFTTTISLESDGVTSGSAISVLLYGVMDYGLMAASGFFHKDDPTPNINTYRDNGGQDTYEITGTTIKKVWRKLVSITNIPVSVVQGFAYFDPWFGERKGAKGVQTPLIYGSGFNAINRANTSELITHIYSRLEAIANMPVGEASNEALNGFVTQYNALANYANSLPGGQKMDTVALSTFPNVHALLNFQLEGFDEKRLHEMNSATRGMAIEAAVTRVSGEMLATRSNLFAMTGAGFGAYNSLFKAVGLGVEADLFSKGELPFRTDKNGNRVLLAGLSPEHIEDIFKLLSPFDSRVVTADGAVSTNSKESSMPTYNIKRVPNDAAVAKSEHKFNRAPFIGKSYTSKSITGVKPALSIGTQAQTWVLESKGAAVSATLVQGVDAYVSMMVQAFFDAAGHHDANTGSIDKAKFMAQLQNKTVIDALIKFHASTNALQAILPPLLGHIDPSLAQYVTPKMVVDVRANTIAEINKYTKGKYTTLEAALNAVVAKSYEADLNKLNMIEQLGTISQYSLEGGQTSISDEQLAVVKEERTKLLKQQKEDYASVQAIVKGFGNATSKQSTNKPSNNVPTQEVVVQQVPVAEPVTVEVTARTKAQQFLEQFNGKTIPVEAVITFLQEGYAKGKDGDSKVAVHLLNLITKILPKNLEINYFMKGAMPAGVIKSNDPNSYAWNVSNVSKGTAQINLMNDGKSLITAEVILHELIHAVTVDAIAYPTKETKAVLARIQKIMDLSKVTYDRLKHNMSKDDQTVLDAAFEDISEFVSVSLSNRRMMQILQSTPTRQLPSRRIPLLNMYHEFVSSIMQLIYGKANLSTEATYTQSNALQAMLYDATLLMSANSKGGTQGDLLNNYPGEQAKADALKRATQYTAAEVFNVLDGSGISTEFNAHLAGVIATVVDNSFSVLEAHDLTGSDTAGYTPYQVWNEKLSQGKVPYASTAMATGFNLSEKELFAVESIEASLNAAMNNGIGTAVHKELKAAFLKARESLKDERVFFAGDWSKASQQQRDQALAKYNFVFKLVGNTNKQEENAYLSRFAALALGSQEFSALLDFPVYTQENRGDKSLSSAISNYFDTAMQWVNGYLSKTVSNQTIKDKLPILAQQLIEIDHKKRDAALPGILEKIGVAQEVGNEVIQDLSEKLADTLKGVPGTKIVQTVLKGKVMDNLDVLKDARNKENPSSPLGWAAELLNELSDANTAQQGMQKFFRKHEVVQNTRKSMIAAMTKNVLNTFIDGGKNLKQEQLEAVTYGLLRTNAQALLSAYGVKGIQDFVGDTVKRNAEISILESQLNDPLLLNRTKDLAWYMVSGEGRTGLAKNTTSILRGVGTKTVVDESKIDPVKLDLLDKLNALYAIEYTRKDHQEALKQLIKEELARKGENGIESTLAYHRGLVEDSKNTLFEGNSVSRIQGWLPEIVNPHREIAIATTEADALELERLGFHLHSQPKTDPNDPVSGTRKVYMTEESTKQRYTTGAISLTTTARKGTSVFTGSDVKGKAAYQAIDKMGKGTAAHLAAHTKAGYDPRKGNTSMIPTYANDGSIIDYNYEMTHESRDSLLQRNNNFAAVLGSYAGTNYDKLESPKHNATVLEAIHNEFLEGYAKSPEAYVEISPHANDPRLREIYAMLPHDAKQEMEKLWGKGEPMMIRNDLLLSTFGAHKLTIGSAFDKNPEQRNIIENTVVSTLEAMFGDTAKLKGLRAERAWQEVAATMKSFIVIRNVKTLLGNQMSNMGILMAMGVNPIDVYQDSAIALKGALQYRKDTAIIINANQQLRAGLGIPSEHHQDILRAQDSLARNPVRDFIAAGMLTSIVEDVSLEEDPYSYKSKYAQRLDEMTGGIPDGVKTGLSYAFVSPKTPLYQLLADATQFSDFTAKYALYKHSTTRAKKKLSHDEAISLADKMFINYGVPTSPELQYMNDMGFLMFTKYTLRIQRAMAHLLKEHPAGALGQTLIASQLGGVSVLDPLFLNNIGNPLRTGALGMPSVIDEPFPVAMLKGLLF